MALLTIKPSRGTVLFFVALGVALLARAGWHKHEDSLVVRDLPPAQATRRLLRCVVGRDAGRVLGDRPASNEPAAWTDRIALRLRQTVVENYGDTWPRRCVALAESLERQLDAAPDGRHASSYARESLRLLNDASRDVLSAVRVVEDGSLATNLGGLALEVSGMSTGAEEGWNSNLPPGPTDLYPVRYPRLADPWPLPAEADGPVLFQPDVLLYQQRGDRTLHAVSFGADGEAGPDRALGAGAPLWDAARESASLVADDGGESLFLPGGEPAERVPLPAALRTGAESLGGWGAALTPGVLWVMNNDGGVLRLRAVPRHAGASASAGDAGEGEGDAQGASARDDAVALLGEPESIAGAVIAPDPAGGDGVWVTAVRRGASGVSVERFEVPAPTAAPEARALGAGSRVALQGGARAGTSANARVGASARADAGPSAGGTSVAAAGTGTPAAPAAPAATPHGETVLGEWAAFDPRVSVCEAGDARYLLVRSDDRLAVVAVHGARVEKLELLYSEFGEPTDASVSLSCNADAALVSADTARASGALGWFDFAVRRAAILAPPRWTSHARVVGAALTEHFGVVALVDNGITLRAYHRPSASAELWEGGALVADQQPATDARAADGDVRTIQVTRVRARGDVVGALADVQLGSRRFVGRLESRDGGASWR